MRTIYRPTRVPVELNQGGTSTSEKVFVDSAGNAVAIFLPVGSLVSHTTDYGKQFARFAIHAAGRVTGGTTTNFTHQLQFGISATPSSNTDIESGAAVAVNSNSGLWTLDAELCLSAAGRLEGYACHLIAGSTRTFTAIAVSDNSITSFDADQVITRQGFVMTGTFSSGNAANAAYLDLFMMEVYE